MATSIAHSKGRSGTFEASESLGGYDKTDDLNNDQHRAPVALPDEAPSWSDMFARAEALAQSRYNHGHPSYTSNCALCDSELSLYR